MHNYKVAACKHVYSKKVAILAYLVRGGLEGGPPLTPCSRGNTAIHRT